MKSILLLFTAINFVFASFYTPNSKTNLEKIEKEKLIDEKKFFEEINQQDKIVEKNLEKLEKEITKFNYKNKKLER